MLTSLVYEKQERLRVMMKMHGLGDGPYWMISYAYFLAISTLYIICFVGFGAFVSTYVYVQIVFSKLIMRNSRRMSLPLINFHLYVYILL